VTTRSLPSAGFSITVRVSVPADSTSIGRLTTAAGDADAIVTALDVVDSDHQTVTVDLTCDTADAAHAESVVHHLESLDGVAASALAATLPVGATLEEALALMLRDDRAVVGVTDGPRFLGVLTPAGVHAALRASL